MAIDYGLYTESKKTNHKLITSLKATPDYFLFLYQPRINGELRRKTFDYSSLSLSKTDRIKKAIAEAMKFKADEESTSDTAFNNKTKVFTVADTFFKHQDKTSWNAERKRQYELHIHPIIGDKALSKLTRLDLDRINTNMKEHGHAKQNIDGCSLRTIHKVFMQILKPILQYGLENGATTSLPSIPKIKKGHNKKTIKNAFEQYVKVYQTVMELYRDDPFYRALFGFALIGRRWNEIASLTWDDIDFLNHTYLIRAENNKIDEDQIYDLPQFLASALISFKDTGLIFISPITGNKLYTPKRQLEKIKTLSGIDTLTMHLFRHLYVSALSKTGIHSSILSDALGHIDSRTLDKHYRTADRLEASRKANKALEVLGER